MKRWQVYGDGQNLFVITGQGDIRNQDTVATIAYKNEANARLIAAAPELLEALKDFIRAWQDDKVTSAISNQVYAAIAKAEGGTGNEMP